MKKITFLRRINQTKYNLAYPTLNEVFGIISSGDLELCDEDFGRYRLKDTIEHIRKQRESDQQALKFRLLPAVAYNGKFWEVSGQNLLEYSNVTALDFDHIDTTDEMAHLFSRLTDTPCVLSVFVTPSGKGLKALVLHDNSNPAMHSDMYSQLLAIFNVASSDTSCKDLARRNYLSYDANIWVNTSAVPFHYEPTTIEPKAQGKSDSITGISGSSIIAIMNKTWQKKHPEYWIEGHRARGIFAMACMLCRWGVDLSLAKRYFTDGWECESMTAEEIAGHVSNAYKLEKGNFGTIPFTTKND